MVIVNFMAANVTPSEFPSSHSLARSRTQLNLNWLLNERAALADKAEKTACTGLAALAARQEAFHEQD